MDKFKQVLATFVFLSFAFSATSALAIQVKVQSTSKKITALGFTVNGKNYGNLGSSYQKTGAPKGNYKFGVRDGKDVPCKTSAGKSTIKLTKNTVATLDYDGKNCTLTLN